MSGPPAERQPSPSDARNLSPPAEENARRDGGSPRASALEAGRLFHTVRVLACELTLSGNSHTAQRLTGEVVPRLVAAVGGMALSSLYEIERELLPRLQSLVNQLGGIDHLEWLQDEQRNLDVLSGQEREDYDLDGQRAEAVRGTLAYLDDVRDDILALVPRPKADAFRLGELLQVGVFPLNPSLHEPSPIAGPVPPVTDGTSSQIGAPAATDQKRLLRLALPPARGCENPWPLCWLAWVRGTWEECGLRWKADVHSAVAPCPVDADARRRAIEILVENAINAFTAFDHPPLTLKDRFRVLDEASQTVLLDGRSIEIQDRKAFRIVKALLDHPDHELSAKELRKLPGCRADISKIIKKLPDELRDIVVGSHGANAVYYILLSSQIQR